MNLRQADASLEPHILLVGDDAAGLAALAQTLDGAIAACSVVASDCAGALAACARRRPAAIVLDVHPPDRALTMARRLRGAVPAPLIFLGGANADAEADFDFDAAFALGDTDHVAWPARPVVLRQRLARLVAVAGMALPPAADGGAGAGAAADGAEQLARAESARLFVQVKMASERLVDIFHRAPAFMAVLRGPGHRFEFVNQRFGALVGQRELLGREVREALPELAGQDFFELLDSVYADGAPREGHAERLLLRRHSGKLLEPRFVDVVYTALREADGIISGVLVHGIDVTERTQASLLALGQRSALELAVSDAPLGDVLDVLAHAAEDYAGGAGLAAIRLADIAGAGAPGRLRNAAAPSLSAVFLADLDRLDEHSVAAGSVAGASGPGALAAATGLTVTVDDIDGDARWPAFRALARVHGLRACRAMPILAPSGDVLGVFCWYYRELRAPSDDEHAALAMLANTASLVIGQRHEALERIAAEDRSHNILESISEGFIAIDAGWRITFANQAAEEVTRIARDSLAGAVFWDAFPSMAGTPIEAGLRRCAALRTAEKFDAWYDPLGGWFEINCCPTPDDGIALYFRDETERRMAQEGIRRLAAVAEQSPDFIGIATPDTVGMFLNPAGRALSGMPDGARVSDYRLADFFAPASRARVSAEVLPALAGSPGRWEGELQFARLDTGALVPVYFKGFQVADERGAIIGLATVTRDITEQKRAEDALRRVASDLADADHRKSEFLATLAHELRNPLAPIRTGLDLLRLPDYDKAAKTRVMGMMDRQLGHLIHLVDDLLDIARINRGKIDLKKAPVALGTLVSMAVEANLALVEASQHTLEVHVPPSTIMLDVDSTRVVQVLSNLINNAAKYTPPGGQIGVTAWREAAGSAGSAEGDGAQAVVQVRDSGVGIASESLGSVFDMFSQVRGQRDLAQGGLGIGLSLVRRLAELHGGSISAASEGRGLGSTFTLRLPLAAVDLSGAGDVAGVGAMAAADAVAEAAEAAAASPSSMRVLIVDDNADAADSLAALLATMGHRAQVALNGPAGLALARSAAPDLVILDIGMPGMSGHEVARAIRATPSLADVTLVALSGWGAPGDLALAEAAGFDRHLTKPVSLDALEAALALVPT